MISDFLDTDQWERELRLLAIRHEVIAVHVTDPREFELPPVGILAVVDAETGRQRYVNTTASVRQKYSAAARLRHQGITSTIHGSGAEYLHLSTDRDAISDTVHFTTHRRARRAASSHTGLVLR